MYKYKVLIVDDEHKIRDRVVNKMPWNDVGFEVVSQAESGGIALQQLKQFHPHVVLSDIRMPGMNGLELIERIRCLYPDVKTAVMSAYDEFKYAQEAIRLGVKGYLVKPMIRSEFVELFSRIVAELKDESLLEQESQASSYVSPQNDRNSYVVAAKEYINKNYEELIRVDDVVSYLHLNPNYFSSLFKRETGYTFIDYVNEIRITKATDLLTKSEMKISEISLMTGFQNFSYFNKIFKKKMRLTPQEYRNSRGANTTEIKGDLP